MDFCIAVEVSIRTLRYETPFFIPTKEGEGRLSIYPLATPISTTDGALRWGTKHFHTPSGKFGTMPSRCALGFMFPIKALIGSLVRWDYFQHFSELCFNYRVGIPAAPGIEPRAQLPTTANLGT